MSNAKIYTLHVTEDEISLIGTTLVELPYKLSAGLIQKIQIQFNQQNQPPAPPPAPPQPARRKKKR